MDLNVKLNTDSLNGEIINYIVKNDNITIHMPDDTYLTDINIISKTAKLHAGLLLITQLGRENFRYIEEVKLLGYITDGKIYLEFELIMGDGYNEFDC